MSRYFEDRMGWTLTNIWNLITYDVEDVVYKTANKVLTEEGVSKEEIHSRAAALKEIGEIFSVSSSKNDCQFEEIWAYHISWNQVVCSWINSGQAVCCYMESEKPASISANLVHGHSGPRTCNNKCQLLQLSRRRTTEMPSGDSSSGLDG